MRRARRAHCAVRSTRFCKPKGLLASVMTLSTEASADRAVMAPCAARSEGTGAGSPRTGTQQHTQICVFWRQLCGSFLAAEALRSRPAGGCSFGSRLGAPGLAILPKHHQGAWCGCLHGLQLQLRHLQCMSANTQHPCTHHAWVFRPHTCHRPGTNRAQVSNFLSRSQASTPLRCPDAPTQSPVTTGSISSTFSCCRTHPEANRCQQSPRGARAPAQRTR